MSQLAATPRKPARAVERRVRLEPAAEAPPETPRRDEAEGENRHLELERRVDHPPAGIAAGGPGGGGVDSSTKPDTT